MKQFLYAAGVVLGIFLVWQWWLGRKDPLTKQAEESLRQANEQGQVKEISANALRPRLVSRETLSQVASWLTGVGSIRPTTQTDATMTPSWIYGRN